MSDDRTLGGYLEAHGRPPAFAGPDGAAYSAAVYVDDVPDENGRFGGALLFVRWSPEGDRPIGHVETPDLVHGTTAAEADRLVRQLSLHDIKAALDRAVTSHPERSG